MKAAWLCVGGALVSLACGSSNEAGKPGNTAGTSSAGASSTAGASSAGASLGGAAGSSAAGAAAQGGQSTTQGGQGTTQGGQGSGGGGSESGGGSSGGAGSMGFQCPSGASPAPVLTGLTPSLVAGLPPSDDFNNMNNNFGIVEGPVWIGDALYVSEIGSGQGGTPPPARVLKVTEAGQVSVAIADAGSNGLAVNAAGELLGALHKDGSISKLSLAGGAATPLVTMFMGQRFDSPNDLALLPDGTIYFSDPDHQAPTPRPQATTRAYRVPPGGQPVAIADLNQPNGVTLSKNRDFLYIGGGSLKRYPVMADGSLGAGTDFAGGISTDGMVVDCGDNLYVAANQAVSVFSKDGQALGSIPVSGVQQITNVAFGGADHKTLYITALGSGTQKGLLKVTLNVAGFPY